MCKLCDAEGALLGELERVILENREDNHNKQYTVYIEQLEGAYRVMVRYGPIGKWIKSDEKSRVLSLSEGRRILHEIVAEKIRKKGYSYRRCVGEAI
jgi:hypothetical protein